MGINWGKFANISLAIAGDFVPGGGIPSRIIKTAHAALGQGNDPNPETGADFAAKGFREMCQATFPPETVERMDYMAVMWAQQAIAERAEATEEEDPPKKKKRKPKRKSRKTPRVKGGKRS